MDETNRTAYAFPIGTADQVFEPGMTMRDYFAAKAMQGLMGRVWGDIPAEELFATWSRSAYALADAMLQAREVA